MNPKAKVLLDKVIARLIKTNPLPPHFDVEDLVDQLNKLNQAVWMKICPNPTDDQNYNFFITFLAGYLCGHIKGLELKLEGRVAEPPKTKWTWKMPTDRN